MVTERDSLFSSDFMKQPVPKEKSWMSKYFKTRTKRMFLKYFVAFGCATRFREHSGEACTKRYVKKMKGQFLRLSEKHAEARRNLDFEMVTKIEMGKCRLR